MTVWKFPMSIFSVMRLVEFGSLAAVLLAYNERSRRKQRGLYPRPSNWGFGETSLSTGATGPRFTDMFLKGPVVTQPEPLEGGIVITGASFDGRPTPLWV
jgi:hypothetical protein